MHSKMIVAGLCITIYAPIGRLQIPGYIQRAQIGRQQGLVIPARLENRLS